MIALLIIFICLIALTISAYTIGWLKAEKDWQDEIEHGDKVI